TDDNYKDWMVLNGNKIEDVGSGDLPVYDTKIDMNGNYIFPGLIDSHIHVYSLGRMSTRLHLDKPGSIMELQNRLQKYVVENSHLEWIVAHDWDQDYMEDGRYPNKSDIDLIVSDRPVLLFRSGNHIAIMNSKALDVIGITSETINPEGGIIDKDEDEEPTGILRETAISMVTEYIRIKDDQTRKKIIMAGLDHCLSIGLTMVQTNDPNCWQIYKELEAENKLPIRVALTLFYADLDIENVPSPNTKINLLTCDRVKLFTDGSLGGQTAALRDVYSDTKKMGVTIHTQDELNTKVKRIKDLGFRLEVHAIGDLAAEYTLNSFEQAGLSLEDRPILTHGQVLSEDLISRMTKSGVIV
ncbi:MAG: amidohydrolase, partial [Candidatus Heimdallarchaeota archaeon]